MHRVPQGPQTVAGGRRAAAHLRNTTPTACDAPAGSAVRCTPPSGAAFDFAIRFRWYSLRSNHRLPSGAALRPRSMHRVPQGSQTVAGGRRAAAHLRNTTPKRAQRSRRDRRSMVLRGEAPATPKLANRKTDSRIGSVDGTEPRRRYVSMATRSHRLASPPKFDKIAANAAKIGQYDRSPPQATR
ncbi:hypothetical protein CA51_50630 [Rosistilla oblonga]|nr:hypothetical protein CA51_50630 [Rosistilla oblonga]